MISHRINGLFCIFADVASWMDAGILKIHSVSKRKLRELFFEICFYRGNLLNKSRKKLSESFSKNAWFVSEKYLQAFEIYWRVGATFFEYSKIAFIKTNFSKFSSVVKALKRERYFSIIFVIVLVLQIVGRAIYEMKKCGVFLRTDERRKNRRRMCALVVVLRKYANIMWHENQLRHQHRRSFLKYMGRKFY